MHIPPWSKVNASSLPWEAKEIIKVLRQRSIYKPPTPTKGEQGWGMGSKESTFDSPDTPPLEHPHLLTQPPRRPALPVLAGG